VNLVLRSLGFVAQVTGDRLLPHRLRAMVPARSRPCRKPPHNTPQRRAEERATACRIPCTAGRPAAHSPTRRATASVKRRTPCSALGARSGSSSEAGTRASAGPANSFSHRLGLASAMLPSRGCASTRAAFCAKDINGQNGIAYSTRPSHDPGVACISLVASRDFLLRLGPVRPRTPSCSRS
jgi:hypothetical protein